MMDPTCDNDIASPQQVATTQEAPRRRPNNSFHHYRLLVAMLGGISFGLMKLLRFNVSVAILNMVNQTELYLKDNPDNTVEDFLAEGYELGGEFSWDNRIQNMIMSWYMISYTIPQVATTKLGIIMGCKLTAPIFLSICALANLLTPMSAYWGWQWVIVMRLINGVGASAVLPMMVNLIENWMPYSEISLGLTVANVMQNIVACASPLLVGFLSAIHWKYAFYGPGVLTLVFCLIWLIAVADRPENSWLISQKELDHIHGRQSSTDDDSCSDNNNSNNNNSMDDVETSSNGGELKKDNQKFTLIDILRVPSFYAYIVCMCLHCSTFNGAIFVLPAYLRQFLKISISENGFYCTVIQIGLILSSLWPHPVWRFLQSRAGLPKTASGRITYAIGCTMVGITWLAVGSFHEFQLLLLFIGRCFHGCNDIVLTGSLMSNYAHVGLSGLAFSVVNSVGNLTVAFSSTLIGWYLDYSGRSREGWFWIFAMLALGQALILAVFGTMASSGPVDLQKRRAEKRARSNSTSKREQGKQSYSDPSGLNKV